MTGAFFIPISIHSTTRVETLSSAPLLRASHRFQSTPPRGWRPQTGGRGDGCGDFNPLHHEGGDPVEVLYPNGVIISIHSTTRVETAILHNNHYYSSTHFHKQIISHPLKSRPTIPAHSQIRSHCANFPVRISP